MPSALKPYRDKIDPDLEQIEVIEDVQKDRSVCPSSGPGYFDQHKVKLAPRIIINKNSNKQNKSSSESIFNDKEQTQINRQINHKAEIDKINK